MNQKTRLLIATTIIAALRMADANAHLEPKENDGMEKCYGIAKAGENSCASKANKHSCAGMAKEDNDPNEWIKVPQGKCDEMGGSTTPRDIE